MAKKYDDYDWRGIAMLTQQMGQLFQPNQAKLMDKKHQHEMNILAAKQAWDTQVKAVDALEKEYDQITKNLEVETRNVNQLGLSSLVRASSSDGANPEQSSEIYDKLDVKKLEDLQAVAVKYQEMIGNQKSNLDNMLLYNDTAKMGEQFSKELTAKTTETREGVKGKDYKIIHDIDKSGTLSWDEQNNVLKDYIKDYYAVSEGEEGMEITLGNETFKAAPEAHAFIAGFRHMRGRKSVDAADLASQIKKLKTPEQYLNTMYNAKQKIEDYEKKGLSKRQLSLTKGPYGDFTSVDVNIYTSSHDLFKEAYKAYTKAGNEIPEDLIGVAPINDTMFYNDPDAYFFNEPKEFTDEGLTPEVYDKIQNSTHKGSEKYKEIAFNIVYNWEDIMRHGEETEKLNMIKALEALKRKYDF